MARPLNERVRDLGHSATMAINARSKALELEGRTISRFGLGQSPFPVPEHVVAALVEHAAEKDYLPVEGLPALRASVAAWHHRVDGTSFEPEGVVIGPGSKELMFLLQVVFDGELVLPSPCWVSYGPQARILGRPVAILPTSFERRWRLSPEQLAAHCATDPDQARVLILNYPGNPDGCSYDEAELQALVEVARQYRIIVVSDEIYGPLCHRGAHVSIARFYPEGTIVSGGLSKWCGAGGWRLGSFAFPKPLFWLKAAISAVASETYTSVSAPVQYAATVAFGEDPEMERYLRATRRILQALGNRCADTLRAVGAQVHPPTGAFYIMVDFEPLRERLGARGISGSLTLADRALEETGVAFLAGAHFQRPSEELLGRLAYVDFDGRAALEACEKMPTDAVLGEDFLRATCPRVIAGIDRLASWLS